MTDNTADSTGSAAGFERVPGETVVPATGNGMKSHDQHDTFLVVSGGSGNRDDGPEVHLQIRSSDDAVLAQGWFAADDLLAAIAAASGRVPGETSEQVCDGNARPCLVDATIAAGRSGPGCCDYAPMSDPCPAHDGPGPRQRRRRRVAGHAEPS